MQAFKEEYGGVPTPTRQDLRPPPHWRLEAVAETPRPHHPAVSPDGDRVVFVEWAADSSDLWVVPAGGGAPTRLTVARELTAYWEDAAPTWSPDGLRVAYASGGAVWVAPVSGGPSRKVAEGSSPVWLDAERLLVGVDRDRVTRLAVVEVEDPWPQALTSADGDAAQARVAPNGKTLVFTYYPPTDRKRSDLRRLDLDTGKVTTLTGRESLAAHSPSLSPEGRRVVYVSEETGWNELHLIGIDGAGARQLTSHEADFSSPAWRADGGAIVAVAAKRAVSSLVTVDPDSGLVSELARGGLWENPSWAPDGSVVALFEDHRTPPRLVRVGPEGTVAFLYDPAPAPVRAAPHVAPESVVFPSADGLEIQGWLFQPERAALGQVPAVVYAHGGPTSHYGDEWDGHAQFFLDKGYAWLALNFRGSTSFGLDFERANHGVWGVADTEDCLAAADYLAGLDWVDGSRIAIFGASYGSYLALCSLVRDPRHRYACGVAKYGDADILTSWAQGDRVGAEDLERMMGHPSQAREAYVAGSPIHLVDRLTRPILVAHGERDERVHPRQSEDLVSQLQSLGKTYEYVTYPTEGHGLLRRAPQLDFYRRLERFLDWYLM